MAGPAGLQVGLAHHVDGLQQDAFHRNSVLRGPREEVQVPGHSALVLRLVPHGLRNDSGDLIRGPGIIHRVHLPRSPPALHLHSGDHRRRALTDRAVERVEVAEVVEVISLVVGDQGIRVPVLRPRHRVVLSIRALRPIRVRLEQRQLVRAVVLGAGDCCHHSGGQRCADEEQTEWFVIVGEGEDLVVDLDVLHIGHFAHGGARTLKVQVMSGCDGEHRVGLHHRVVPCARRVPRHSEADAAVGLPHREQQRTHSREVGPLPDVEVLERANDLTVSRLVEHGPHARSDAQRTILCDRTVVHNAQARRFRHARRVRGAPPDELAQVRLRERPINRWRGRLLRTCHQMNLPSECGCPW